MPSLKRPWRISIANRGKDKSCKAAEGQLQGRRYLGVGIRVLQRIRDRQMHGVSMAWIRGIDLGALDDIKLFELLVFGVKS